MKTKEELNALKEEVEALNKKLAELTDEELAQVSGGLGFDRIIGTKRLIDPVVLETADGKHDFELPGVVPDIGVHAAPLGE